MVVKSTLNVFVWVTITVPADVVVENVVPVLVVVDEDAMLTVVTPVSVTDSVLLVSVEVVV